MSYVQPMLETYPGEVTIDPALLAETIRMLGDCAQACSACADACLAEQEVAALTRCIRLNLDCADVCEVTSRILSRQTGGDPAAVRALVEACAQVCHACADECAQHGQYGMAHCKVCADACSRCLTACEQLLDALPT